RARARVQEAAPGRYILELEITAHGDVSTRRVEASSCEELADAATLLIAMVIDPTAGEPAEAPAPVDEVSAQFEQEPAQPPTSEEATPEGPSPPADPQPPTEPSPKEISQPEGLKQPALRVGVGAELALGGAGLPGFGAGTGLNVALLRKHLRAALFARYHLPRTRALAGLEETDAAVRYDLVVGGARGCGVGEVGARVGVELFGCVGVELGAMRGVGRGLPVSASYTGLWAAALLTPGLAIPVTPRLAVVARGDVGVALSRPRFAVLNYGDAFRAPAVSYAFSLGIELRAPPAPLRRRPKKSGTDPAARGQSPREPPSR
ncbi:MAG: hypothetical protein KC486_35935, partial [Myxococcales bacterium]|nr:hypothetical protein [Myxococcales bacterium]